MENFLSDLFADQSYDKENFFLIAGPCVVESEELTMEVAEKFQESAKILELLIYLNRLIAKPIAQVVPRSPVLVMKQLLKL
jgi:3-deoxy-D-arabino-heptulosonate 7-phosphate (DAHP) synthase